MNALVGVLGLVDQDSGFQNALDRGDPCLDDRLLILRVVVFAVLGKVASLRLTFCKNSSSSSSFFISSAVIMVGFDAIFKTSFRLV